MDERFDDLLCRLILGDRAEVFREADGRLLPFASPPAMFKGERPASVILHGEEIQANTWKKVVLAVLRDCDADPQRHQRMLELRGRINGNFRTLLSDCPEGMAAPLKINEGLYWESKFDTEALLGNLTEKVLDKERGSRSAPARTTSPRNAGRDSGFRGFRPGVSAGVRFEHRGSGLPPRSRNRLPFQDFSGFQAGVRRKIREMEVCHAQRKNQVCVANYAGDSAARERHLSTG